MLCNDAPRRLLIAFQLTVSLLFTGTVPPPAMGIVRAQTAPPEAAPCCCGSENDSCCGMACCVPRSPSTPAAPHPAPPSDDYEPRAGGMVTSAADAFYLTRWRASQEPGVLPHRKTSQPSLQYLQVRLDV